MPPFSSFLRVLLRLRDHTCALGVGQRLVRASSAAAKGGMGLPSLKVICQHLLSPLLWLLWRPYWIPHAKCLAQSKQGNNETPYPLSNALRIDGMPSKQMGLADTLCGRLGRSPGGVCDMAEQTVPSGCSGGHPRVSVCLMINRPVLPLTWLHPALCTEMNLLSEKIRLLQCNSFVTTALWIGLNRKLGLKTIHVV